MKEGGRNAGHEVLFMKYIFLILLLFTAHLNAAVYYVDFTTGLDSDTGLTTALAWKTVKKVTDESAATTFTTGDSILFKRGETWVPEASNLTIDAADGFTGSATSRATIGAYGTGNDPILLGYAAATTWVDTTQTSDTGESVYKKDYAAGTGRDPVVVLEDGTLLKYVAWDTDLATTIAQTGIWVAGSFTFDPDDNTNYYSYVETSTGVDPDAITEMLVTQERALAVDSMGIYIKDCSYVTIENLDVRGAGIYGIWLQTNTGVDTAGMIVQNCTVSYSANSGVVFENVSATSTDTNTGDVISGCTLAQNGGAGAGISGDSVGKNAHNGRIQNCTANGNGWRVGAGALTAAYHTGCVMSDNTVYDQVAFWNGTNFTEGVGLYFDVYCYDGLITRSISYDNEGAGIQISGSGGTTNTCMATYNLIWNCGKVADSGQNEGIRYSDTGDGNSGYYNSIYDCQEGASFATQTNLTFKYNIIMNSVDYDIVAATLTGLDIDYNCVYNGSVADFMVFDTVAGTWAEWLAASSMSAQSINADPKFVDAANDNFYLAGNSPCLGIGKYNKEYPLGRNRYNYFGIRR